MLEKANNLAPVSVILGSFGDAVLDRAVAEPDRRAIGTRFRASRFQESRPASEVASARRVRDVGRDGVVCRRKPRRHGLAQWALPHRDLRLGIVAGLLILFEFLLWPRKTLFRVWRIGRTQVWMRAHIWLGLLTVPLIVLHSWRELGGALTTTLVVLFAIVIASGIWGLVVQQFLPRAMLAQVPAETIYTQIDGVIENFRREARLLVAGVGRELSAENSAGGTATTSVNLELFEKAFATVIEPYLSAKSRGGSALADGTRSAHFFRGLRDQLPIGVHPTIDRLETFCEQRRQFALQARLHFWLHNWLWVHLPLSAALVVLMLVHIVVAIKFW